MIRTPFILLIALILALIAPRLIIDDTHISDFPLNEQQCVQDTVNSMKRLVGNSLEPVIITGYKILYMKQSLECSSELTTVESCNYEASIQLFTFFGIPYKRIHIKCDSVWVE